MKPEQFDTHELSIMLLAIDMALHDMQQFEKEAKRRKQKDRRKLCMMMFLQTYKIREKAERLLDAAPRLEVIDGGKKQ